jgi:hypothetical protein
VLILFKEQFAMKMTSFGLSICAVALPALLSGCAIQEKKTEQKIENAHYTCATADGELRMLDSEKKTTAQRISAGVRSVVPITLVVGLVTGTAGVKYRIATGEYNKMIDNKIAEIKQTCPDATADI